MNEMEFTGSISDTSSGLYYMNARYYNPKTGRFLTQDAMGGDAWTNNLYSYCGNNPVNFKDPTGYFFYYSNMQMDSITFSGLKYSKFLKMAVPVTRPPSTPTSEGTTPNSRETPKTKVNRDRAAYDAIKATQLGNDIGDFDDLIFDERYDNGAFVTVVRRIEKQDGLISVTSFTVIQGDYDGILSYSDSEDRGSTNMVIIAGVITAGVLLPVGAAAGGAAGIGTGIAGIAAPTGMSILDNYTTPGKVATMRDALHDEVYKNDGYYTFVSGKSYCKSGGWSASGYTINHDGTGMAYSDRGHCGNSFLPKYILVR